LGARLDRPENFWGLPECPEDWALPPVTIPSKLPLVLGPPLAPTKPALINQSPEALLDLVAQRLEAPMRKMIAESIAPLQAEVAAVKEKLTRREANPSRFEVSLSQIPPELEQQLETRLKKEVGPKVLEESRQQYAHLLETAKSAIDQQIVEAGQDFRRRAGEELKVVEKRAQEMSAQISGRAEEHVRRGLEDFQQKLLDGGNSLKRLSEELLDYLQQSLNDEHHARRHDLEQLLASVTAESSRLRRDVESLDGRIAKLHESTHSLESGLDKRLGEMAGHTVQDARSQLDAMASASLQDMAARSSKLIEEQVAAASEKISGAQSRTIESVSESLDEQSTSALQAFEHSMNDMAKASVEGWRQRLAGSLNGLAKSLSEQLGLDS
jgi:hypothetical protein